MFELASTPQEMGDIVLQGIALGRLAFRRLFTLASLLAFTGLLSTLYAVWGKGDLTMASSLLDIRWDGPGFAIDMASLAVSLFLLALFLRRLDRTAHGQTEALAAELRAALKAWPHMLAGTAIFFASTIIGLFLLLVPGIILAVSLAFWPFVMVLEGSKPINALNASHNLVWGWWWRTLGLLILIVLPLTFVMSMVLMLLPGVVTSLAPGATALPARVVLETGIVEMVSVALFYPFIYSILYVYYNDLKLRRQETR